ncbi:MAG TPA: hypothetical protein VF479_08150, partial [Pseudolysinimonas sp.]
MRWARFRRWNAVLTVALLLWLAGWILGPLIGLTVPFVVGAVGSVILLAANATLLLLTVRAMRADAMRVVAAHSGTVAFPTSIAAWPGSERPERESVIAVTADRRGLSFRDHEDREVLILAPERVMSLELT